MRKTLRTLLFLTAFLLLGAVALVVTLPRVLDLSDRVPELKAQLEATLGVPVKVDDKLYLDLSRGVGVRTENLSVLGLGEDGRGEILHAESATFVLQLTPLLFDDEIKPAGIVLKRPTLRLTRRDGRVDLPAVWRREESPTETKESIEALIEQALRNAPVEFFAARGGRVLLVEHPKRKADAADADNTPQLLAGPKVMELADVKLEIGPIRPFTPIEIALAARVQPGGRSAGAFAVDGSTTFRSARYDLHQAQLTLRGEFNQIDWDWIAAAPGAAQAGLSRGRFGGRLSLTGNPLSHFVVEGTLTGNDVKGSWPGVWAVPLEPKSLRLPLLVERHGGLVEIRVKDGDVNGMNVASLRIAWNRLDDTGKNSDFAMDLEVNDARWEKDYEFYPWMTVPPDTREELRARIARVGGSKHVTFTTQARVRDGVLHTDYDYTHLEADLSEMEMRVGADEGGPTLKDLNGSLVLRRGGLYFEPALAKVDGILPLRFWGGFPDIVHDSLLQLDISGKVNLPELASVAPRYAFPAFRDALVPLRQGSGKIQAEAKMSYHITRGDFDYNGRLQFKDVEAPVPVAGVHLSSLEGEIRFTHESLETSLLRANIGTSPARFSFLISGPQSDRPDFSLSMDGEDIALGPVVAAWGGERGYVGQGRFSLRDVRVRAGADPNAPLQVTGSIHVKNAQFSAPFLAKPLEDVNCIFVLSDGGNRNDFGCETLFGTSDLKLSGVISDIDGAGPSGRIRVESLYFDVDNLLENVDWSALPGKSEEPSDEPQMLQVDRMIAGGVRIDTIEVAPLKPAVPAAQLPSTVSAERIFTDGRYQMDLQMAAFQYGNLRGRQLSGLGTVSRGEIEVDALTFEGPGGTYRVTEALIRKESGGAYQIVVNPKLEGLNAHEVANWFGIARDTIEGKLDLTGTLSARGTTRRELVGSLYGKLVFHAYDGRIINVKNAKILAQILTLLHWKGVDTYKQGVPFREVTGVFEFRNGVARTDDLMFDSPKFSIRTSGKLDFNTQKIAMVARVKIVEPLDFAINQIPVVRMLTDKQLSLFYIPVPIQGSWKDPEVRLEAQTQKELPN